jgi:putative chitinase
VTLAQLKIALPHASAGRIAELGQALIDGMEAAEITTPLRMAHFLAQIAHESGSLARVEENLNYSAEGLIRTWPSKFNLQNAKEYAHQPEKIGSRAYADRMGNGPEESGDGFRFRGRGLIQLTGRANYRLFGASVGRDLEAEPEAVSKEPALIVGTATWFWSVHNLNALADADDLAGITRVINGGTLTVPQRQACLADAKRLTMSQEFNV